MKGSFPVVCVLAALVFAAPAPDAQAQSVRSYGMSGSIISSNIHSPAIAVEGSALSFDTKRRTGFGASAFAEWSGTSTLSLLTEIGYVQRGFANAIHGRDAENRPTGTLRFEERFDYVSFGAALKMRRERSSATPYLLAGPQFSMKLGGRPAGEGSLASMLSPGSYGAFAGAGVELLETASVGLFTEIRYSADLSNSLPDAPRDVYHNALEVRMGLRF